MEIPRFLDALRRYHPWVWFFTGVSRVRTRALRFLPTFKYILTSIFLSTILFDFYYPASSCADFNKNPLACVTAPAKLPYGESLCVYSSSSDVCGLRPPLRSTSFLLAVALVTFSIMIPYNILFYSVLINVCSKHPQSLFWFGDEVIELDKPLDGAIVDDRVNRL